LDDTGLPDGLFSYQKFKFWYFLSGLDLEVKNWYDMFGILPIFLRMYFYSGFGTECRNLLNFV
jgi:hypothetical protein